MKRIIATLAAGLIATGLASARDLAFYKATYEKEIETIILSHGMQMTELSQKYTESLDSLLAKVKKAGDLDKTTAVLEEIKRFGAERTIPQNPSGLLNIQNLQALFTRQAYTHEANKARRVISLIAKYDQALERLQRALVSSDKLDAAKEVQTERRAVATNEDVVSAKALLLSVSKTMVSTAFSTPKSAKPKRVSLVKHRCTIHWSCADVADVYLNGKPVRKFSPSFHSRKDEAYKRFSARIALSNGDIFTVGGRRGQAAGFLLVAVDKSKKSIYRTGAENWKAYTPDDNANWFKPEVARASGQIDITVLDRQFVPQAAIKAEYDPKAESIWDEGKTITYLYSVVGGL